MGMAAARIGRGAKLSDRNQLEKAMKSSFSLFSLGAVCGALALATSPLRAQTQPEVVEAMPDLIVSDVELTETESEIGDDSHLLVRVQNLGNAPIERGTAVTVSFSVDGKVVAWSDTFRYTIAPGDFAILRSNNGPDGKGTWKVEAGTHEIRAMVDEKNRIHESKETNNTAELTLKK